jgi:hypothetical protein
MNLWMGHQVDKITHGSKKASGGSTVVEHQITHPEIEGSNPGATEALTL